MLSVSALAGGAAREGGQDGLDHARGEGARRAGARLHRGGAGHGDHTSLLGSYPVLPDAWVTPGKRYNK